MKFVGEFLRRRVVGRKQGCGVLQPYQGWLSRGRAPGTPTLPLRYERFMPDTNLTHSAANPASAPFYREPELAGGCGVMTSKLAMFCAAMAACWSAVNVSGRSGVDCEPEELEGLE